MLTTSTTAVILAAIVASTVTVDAFAPSINEYSTSILRQQDVNILPSPYWWPWATSWSITSLRVQGGLDYEAIENDEECDFGGHQLPDRCLEVEKSIDTGLKLESDLESGAQLNELPTPNQSLSALDVVSICMRYLQNSGSERKLKQTKSAAGLEVCFNFSSDSCQAANGGSLETFLQYTNNRNRNPTFQAMVNCERWDVVNVGPEIEGTNTRGAMRTVLVNVVPISTPALDGKKQERRFLWTLMKERRPPRQGCFLIHECVPVQDALYEVLEK